MGYAIIMICEYWQHMQYLLCFCLWTNCKIASTSLHFGVVGIWHIHRWRKLFTCAMAIRGSLSGGGMNYILELLQG